MRMGRHLWLGGDGNITLPLLRAAHKYYPNLVVVHIDAHTDTYRSDSNQDYMRYNVATTFTRAAEEGLIDVAASMHVGPRGPTNDNTVFDYTRDVGFKLVDGHELFEIGLVNTANLLVSDLQGRDVYLCFDMDFLIRPAHPVCARRLGAARVRVRGLGF